MTVTRLGKGTGNRTVGSSVSLGTSWTSFNITSSDVATIAVVLLNISISTNSTDTSCSVTYGSSKMVQLNLTQVGSSTSRAAAGIYYLFNPPTGAQTATVTSGGTSTKAAIAGIDIAFSGVSTIDAAQTVALTKHDVSSVLGGYALRVLSNGVTTGTLNLTSEYAAGTAVAGIGDFIAVQSAVGASPSVLFTASGTATTPDSVACSLNPIGPVHIVQIASSAQVTGTSQTLTLPAACAVGDIIVVGFNSGPGTVSSVTDSAGNGYVVASPSRTVGAPTFEAGLYYAPVTNAAAAGTNVVTVTMTGPVGNLEVIAAEYSGMLVLDQNVSAISTTGQALASGNKTTITPNELIIGYGVPGVSITDPGIGFSGRIVGTDASHSLWEDMLVALVGSYSATGTQSTSTNWIMFMATFRVVPPPTKINRAPIMRASTY